MTRDAALLALAGIRVHVELASSSVRAAHERVLERQHSTGLVMDRARRARAIEELYRELYALAMDLGPAARS